VKAMRSALKTVRDLFLIRSCNLDLTEDSIAKKKFKVCLDYHIKKCEGPCEGHVSLEHYNTLLGQAEQVLRGKTKTVIESLKKEMTILADASRFEEAAKVRDRMNELLVYSEKQKIVDTAEADRDIIGIVSDDNDACAVIFKVREGKMIGSQHHYLANISGKPFAELIEAVLERYYLEQEDIPPELFLSDEVTSVEVVQEWLQKKSGHPVQVQSPKSGEKAKLIALVRANAQFWLDELQLMRLKRGDVVPHSLQALQRDLHLPVPPRRIECFDISTIQGTDTVASLVVFADGKPKKSEYRKFKIRTVVGPDDFASMQEVVERRYSRALQEKTALPDLIMVDGGKGQLSSALEVLQKLQLQHVPMIGLAKRLEEVFLPGQEDSLQLPRTSSGLRLLQQVRDEAHRFAITFHRSLRAKRIIQTELDMIKGIGKKKAEELLKAFGSLEGVRAASREQLAHVIGESAAVNVRKYFSSGTQDSSREL